MSLAEYIQDRIMYRIGTAAVTGLVLLVCLAIGWIITSGEMRYVRYAEDLATQDPVASAKADFADGDPTYYRLREDGEVSGYPNVPAKSADGDDPDVDYETLDLIDLNLTSLDKPRAEKLNRALIHYAETYNAAMAQQIQQANR